VIVIAAREKRSVSCNARRSEKRSVIVAKERLLSLLYESGHGNEQSEILSAIMKMTTEVRSREHRRLCQVGLQFQQHLLAGVLLPERVVPSMLPSFQQLRGKQTRLIVTVCGANAITIRRRRVRTVIAKGVKLMEIAMGVTQTALVISMGHHLQVLPQRPIRPMILGVLGRATLGKAGILG
jgi:hypothetical protein